METSDLPIVLLNSTRPAPFTGFSPIESIQILVLLHLRIKILLFISILILLLIFIPVALHQILILVLAIYNFLLVKITPVLLLLILLGIIDILFRGKLIHIIRLYLFEILSLKLHFTSLFFFSRSIFPS